MHAWNNLDFIEGTLMAWILANSIKRAANQRNANLVLRGSNCQELVAIFQTARRLHLQSQSRYK